VCSAVEFSTAHKSEEIRVPLITLDSYLSECNLPEPRCVKIDGEGTEILILKGAKQVLSSNADLLCELHPYAWRSLVIRSRKSKTWPPQLAVAFAVSIRTWRSGNRRSMAQYSWNASMVDRIVGISNHTLDTFLAGRASRPECDAVHYYGLDPTQFENVAADRAGFRRQGRIAQCNNSFRVKSLGSRR